MRILIFICYLIMETHTALGCLYPSTLQNASWYDSTRGLLTFTHTDMTGYDVTSYASTVTDWECFSIYGNKVISRGKTTVYLFGHDQDVYLCMEMTMITDASFYYYKLHDEEPNASNERVYIIRSGTVISDVTSLCQTSQPIAGEEYNVLVKQDSEATAQQWCPTALLGKFYYSYTTSSGSSCGAGSEWDVCTNRTKMTFNYNQCPTVVAFSDLEVFCVVSLTVSNTVYLTVFNNGSVENVNYYRYTCMALRTSGTVVHVSLQKNKCDIGQSPTVLPSGGALATLTPYYTCPFVDGDSDTVTASGLASIIGAVFAVTILLILVILIFVLYMKLKKKKTIKPDHPVGPRAYFVREFTFEKLQSKLRNNENYPESVSSSISSFGGDYNEPKQCYPPQGW